LKARKWPPIAQVTGLAASRRRFLAGATATVFGLASGGGALAAGQGASPLGEALARAAAFDPELARFYASRAHTPLWLTGGAMGEEAGLLLELFRSADLDGIAPAEYIEQWSAASAAASRGNLDGLAEAEIALSAAFAGYVRQARRVPSVPVIYGEPGLEVAPSVQAVLTNAASASSLAGYLTDIGWMHPRYSELRTALAAGAHGRRASPELLRLNLERARALPAHLRRYVLVDTTAAKLYLYDEGELRHTMRVVVGTPNDPTPMIVSTIYYATLKPYWHVPPDMTAERIAPRVLSEGMTYFENGGYEVTTDWSKTGRVLDPAAIDWKAVAAGREEIFVRQKPGPRNGMGNFKFSFPNELGIYLHDTTAKQLFNEDQRGFSAGCVRLEDAELFGALINGGSPLPEPDRPETHVLLPKSLPVFITYLTAAVEGEELVRRADPYGWDEQQLVA
jgi:L,D-transpeptidase YcbB